MGERFLTYNVRFSKQTYNGYSDRNNSERYYIHCAKSRRQLPLLYYRYNYYYNTAVNLTKTSAMFTISR